MRFNEIISEIKLNEGRDSSLWHGYKEIPYVIKALQDNAMYGTSIQRWWDKGIEYKYDTQPDYDESYWMKGISLTRDPIYAKEWGFVVFELDQTLLSNNYKIIPFSWGKTIDPSMKAHHKREREEFLILEKEPNSYWKKNTDFEDIIDQGEYALNSMGKKIRDTNGLMSPATKRLENLSKYLKGIYISKKYQEFVMRRPNIEFILNHPKYKGLI